MGEEEFDGEEGEAGYDDVEDDEETSADGGEAGDDEREYKI